MKRAECNMHKGVSEKNYQMVYDIIQYKEQTDCNWESAIEKFTITNQIS